MKQAKISVDDDGMEPQVCVIEVRCYQEVAVQVVHVVDHANDQQEQCGNHSCMPLVSDLPPWDFLRA